MDISSLLSPTATPTPGTGSPINSSPVPGTSTAPTPSTAASHHHHNQHHQHQHQQPHPHPHHHNNTHHNHHHVQHHHPYAPSSPSSTRRDSHPSPSSYQQQQHPHPHLQQQSQSLQQHQQQQQYHHHISQHPPPHPPGPLASASSPIYSPHHHQQQQLHHHQSSPIHHHHRPSLSELNRAASTSALPHSRKQSQPYPTSHPDVRRESLPTVSEKPIPPAPIRHHSLNYLDNPTFAPSPLGAPSQIPTSTPSPSATGPSLPPHPRSPHPHPQNRIPSFSSDRGPLSRTGSTASLITMDEEQRARNETGNQSRRVSRAKSSSSAEMVVPEPIPSTKDAPPELFWDDEDEDVDMDEDDESMKPLGVEEIERLGELIEKLDHAYNKDELDAEDAPPTYADCTECIALLRRGFVASKFDKNYDFMERLNEERERMLNIYPLTEQMWVEWLHDTAIHAEDVMAKVSVMELWARSVAHEPGSVALWKGYAKFVLRTWREATRRGEAEGGDDELWADIFNFELVGSVLSKAVGDTMYNIPKSHEIWNKHVELQILQLKAMPSGSQSKIDKIQKLYLERLRIPHDDLDSTFSAYSSFVTTYLPNADYEAVMKAGNDIYQKGKKVLEDRQRFEYRVRNSYGQDEEGQVWSEYLEWETTRHHPDLNLCQGLYERCVLRYPTDSAAWEEYLYFMLEKKATDPAILPLMERATAHCQWSGTLWSHRILAFDVRQQPFESIERIKHQATTSRLMVQQEEMFKVHLAWCGVLKRRGTAKNSSDADMEEVAEFGLRSTLTEIGSLDQGYRIARLLISFLTQNGDIDGAEEEWRKLEAHHAKEYEFWLRYYGWAVRNTGSAGATVVMKKASANWKTLDWPEKIIDIYSTQIEDYGEGMAIEACLAHIRRLRKQVARRRQREAQEDQSQAQASLHPPGLTDVKGKRRRSSNVEDDDALPHKKARASEDVEMRSIPAGSEELETTQEVVENGVAAAKNQKEKKQTRDREKLTIFAKNLPADIDELSVRKFFKGCGTINTLKLVVGADNESATASIEFQNTDDVLAARTRDKKRLNGREITVEVGHNTTVYITNFPPTADEKWIRELLRDCGPIVEVRFPSLKYNTHRRFCYVQFEASEDAEKAVQFDKKDVEGYILVSKFSDPIKKPERSGAVQEGREVLIRNIDYEATEDEIRELFEKYGTIQDIRLISHGKQHHSGYGFLDFETAEAAKASLELNSHKLRSRKLMVVIGETQGGAPPSKKTSGKTQAKAPNAAAGSPMGAASPVSTTVSDLPDIPDRDTIRQKTLYVLGVADTVNDSKIRSAFEKYGSLRKVQLKLQYQAAVVEFDDVKDAGKASLALDGHEIDGRAISFGSFQDMLKTEPEKKVKPGENPFAKKKQDEKAADRIVPVRVHRPGLAVRGGKIRPGFGFRSSKPEINDQPKGDTAAPKTNAEFRQMLLKGKAEAPEDKE
ncbi:Splicing factor [Orbilia ellipsospora]|uniref:U4/U6 snRNA-associated-splicing factor PRP24 n=1 Tax=Orbilia ellipsospora TaxID=2528407 RepID=A0AAV9WV23_9PEZI